MEWLSLGMNIAGGIMSYQADKAANKAARALQAYNNAMTKLSDSINQNAITTNSILTLDASTAVGTEIRKNAISTQAQIETSAAAADVKGRSVNQAMFDVMRNGANREFERQQNLRNSFLAFDQERLNSRMASNMQQDYSYLPKPNFASYMLNAAAKSKDSISSIYNGWGK